MSLQELLDLIRNRSEKKTEFGRGILTADKYVKSMANLVGLDACYHYIATNQTSFDDIFQKAANTLVYSNDEMLPEETATSVHGFKNLMEGAGEKVQLPKNTLMVFRHKLTTSMEDRDKDILRSEGMELDPKMLLLWQHIHTIPLGPYLYTVSQDSKEVRVVSAIVDMNQTTHDAAVMVDNGMGRFSHGFNALEFDKRKDSKGKETGGFDIRKAEILEESLVSVPANPGAEMEEVLLSLVEGGKLKSPVMRSIGKSIRENRPLQSQGISIKYRISNGAAKQEIECASLEDLQEAVNIGLIGVKNEEKENENKSVKSGDGGTEEKSGAGSTSKETEETTKEEHGGDEKSTSVPEVEIEKKHEETETNDDEKNIDLSVGEEEDTSYNELTVKEAMCFFIENATVTERNKMKKLIDVLEATEKSNDRAERFRKLVN